MLAIETGKIPRLSLTDFVDFYLRQGLKRVTKVTDIKTRDKYHPAFDLYKRIRDAIIELHSNNLPLSHLADVVDEQTDPKKHEHYPEICAGYKKFLGKKKPTWWSPPSGTWHHGEVSVHVNPELGLLFNGKRYLIKLFFKTPAINKKHVEGICHLMHHQLASDCPPGTIMAVLDVRSGKLHCVETGPNPNFLALIAGEADSFATIWKTLV